MSLLVINSDPKRLWGDDYNPIPPGSIFYYTDGTYKVIPPEVTTLTDSVTSEYEITKEGLERVELDETVVYTSWNSSTKSPFRACESLKSFSAPGLTNLATGCFQDSSVLESISIPAIITIEDYAFDNCKSLDNIELPSTLATINNGVFRNCKSLKTIEIPDTVTKIGNTSGAYRGEVFSGCTSLESCTLPASTIKGIIKKNFYLCSNLSSITIPDNYTYIESEAFSACGNLEIIRIGSGMTTIGDSAFYLQSGNHQKDRTIIITATTPPTLGYQSLAITNYITGIYVPSESVDSYKAASGWSDLASKIYSISEL